MTTQEWATLTLEVLSILGVVGVGVRWIVKKYVEDILSELKPNSGSSLKDQVTRLELRANEADQMRRDMDRKLDKMYSILIDYISKSNK